MKSRAAWILSFALAAVFAGAVGVYYLAAPPVRAEHANIPQERMLSGGDEGWERRTVPELLPDERININTASTDELKRLPGIGDVLAGEIVAYREENGPFTALEELLKVKGIGEARLAAIIDHITVGD